MGKVLFFNVMGGGEVTGVFFTVIKIVLGCCFCFCCCSHRR
jgi:hypothetical protein